MSHRRGIVTVLGAIFQKRHWRALRNSFAVYDSPVTELYLYVSRSKSLFPRTALLRTPTGPLALDLYHADDMMTVNEVFCREDYACPDDAKVFVDFGSNIGISAAYFLTRNDTNYCYLFEPNPVNVERLVNQLEKFKGRYSLEAVGVAVDDGVLEFGFEPSGRYGGAGLQFPDKQMIGVRSAEVVLREIIEKRGRIDLLKIDIESLEVDILQSLSEQTLSRIELILVEHKMSENLLSATHDMSREGPIARFSLKPVGSVRDHDR